MQASPWTAVVDALAGHQEPPEQAPAADTTPGWRLMLDHLNGRPAPTLPSIPGRRHELFGALRESAPAEQIDVLRSPLTHMQCAELLGMPPQRVAMLRRRLVD